MSRHAAVRTTPGLRQAVNDLRDNPGQWSAYESTGHCVVLAGPGSGKTKTLTVKIARLLLEDVEAPRGLACVTYSNECARELRARLESLGITESDHAFVGTVHSFCLRQIVLPYAKLAGVNLPSPLRIAVDEEREVAYANAVNAVLGNGVDPGMWRVGIDRYRRTHIDRNAPEWHEDDELAALVEQYEQALRRQGVVDFDDMVLVALRLVEEHGWVRKAVLAKFPVIVVDEYQDLGSPLHRMVLSLCFRAGCRLFAVGDPDQSIYGFTGAQPDLLRQLANRHDVEQVVLPFNYRSGPTIVSASEIALGEVRGYEARGAPEGTVDFHERPDGIQDQADFICSELIPAAIERLPDLALGDIAVLYLDRNDGEVIAQSVEAHGYKSIRVDQGGPYRRTPMTRLLEDCASWCSGGWRSARPRLSQLISQWRGLLRIAGCSEREIEKQINHFVRFLFRHRDPDAQLYLWVRDFEQECLGSILNGQLLRDERDAVNRLVSVASAGGALERWSVKTFGGQRGSPDHLNLVTLHSAKGLEFRVVILMGMDQGRIPRWGLSDVGKREPRRLFYVGLSRAKDEVHMTFSGFTVNKNGRRFVNGPSEFLIEVRDRLA